MVNQPPQPLDFEANERRIIQRNLAEMPNEIANREERLAVRIHHFADLFGIPEDNFWRDLEANPVGPLAATLAKEARRQNIHEQAAAEYVGQLPHVENFRKLPSVGPNAMYITRDGQFISGRDLGPAPKPSKSIDFQWETGALMCYAAQKYTREGGGNQDNQFNEIESLLINFMPRINNNVALFALVDGPYYTEARLAQLQGRVRMQAPMSYVTSVNQLMPILQAIAG